MCAARLNIQTRRIINISLSHNPLLLFTCFSTVRRVPRLYATEVEAQFYSSMFYLMSLTL